MVPPPRVHISYFRERDMATAGDIATGGDPATGRETGADHESRPSSLREILEGVERDILLNALRESHGNKAKAARTLGITERLMGIRVKSLGIDWRSLRRKRS